MLGTLKSLLGVDLCNLRRLGECQGFSSIFWYHGDRRTSHKLDFYYSLSMSVCAPDTGNTV